MKSKVKYIDNDVYTEAKNRIKHVILSFDKLFVCFSGGKDSLVVLNLLEDVYKELEIKEKINVIFRDEELIPDNVVNFVQEHAKKTDKYNFYYYAVPLYSNKFILGKTIEYVQWDKNRKWIRQKSKNAITLPKSDKRVFSQYQMDKFIAEGHKGKLAYLTGIRADESLIRYRACISKKNENYITATEVPNVKLVKPIYDWSEKDVFKYFYDNGIKYCEIYDIQMLNGERLRVSTPLHAESSKEFDKIKTRCPVFYQQLINLFPEMLIQEKYWNDLDRYGIIYQYEHSFDGIFKYINDNLEENMKDLAKKRVLLAKTIRENKLKKGQGLHNFGGYPILHVFKSIVNGQFKRNIQPKIAVTKAEIEYENN
jgi:predicted phosphoadenosine phosphosulfate sulfurtransferase